MSIVWSQPARLVPTGRGWGSWRRPQPRITFERDSAPDEWAWEALGLPPEEPPRLNWVLTAIIVLFASCPAVALGLLFLLDR